MSPGVLRENRHSAANSLQHSGLNSERKVAMVAVSDRVISGPRAVLKPYETRKLLALPDKRTVKGRRAAALLALLACGGLRGIEAAAVRVSGIEPYKAGSIAVTFRCAKRKQEEYRSVVLPAYAARLVTGWMDSCSRATYWLFPGNKGDHISTDTVQRTCTQYLKLLGRSDMRGHGLRHSFASQVVREVDIYTASQLLGHRSLDMTRRFYASFDLKDAAKAADALASAMLRRSPRLRSP